MMCVTKRFPSCVSNLLASPHVSLTPRYEHFGARALRSGPDRATRRGVDGGHAFEYGARASGFGA